MDQTILTPCQKKMILQDQQDQIDLSQIYRSVISQPCLSILQREANDCEINHCKTTTIGEFRQNTQLKHTNYTK